MPRPAMRVRVVPRFPARINPGTGIAVTRSGGAVIIAQDWSGIQEALTPPIAATFEFLVRQDGGAYLRVPGDYIILPVLTWDTLTGKPSTFPPSAHTQDISTINGLQVALDAKVETSATIAVNRGGTGQTTYTNGQLLIGNTTGNTLDKATLTAGSGVTVTNGSGSISVAVTAGQIPGTATNNAATAGNVGEHVSSTIVSGSAVALTTATTANVTSISLTAGDWDVWVNARFTGGATTTVTILQAGISTTSATLSTTPGQIANTFHNGQSPFASTTLDIPVGAIRMSLASTTTVYFVASATFATSTCSAFGIIQARRRR